MISKPLRRLDRIFILLIGVIVIAVTAILIWVDGSTEVQRPPLIAYLGDPLEKPEVWITDLEGLDPVPLTSTQGRVFDFAVSPDGETVIYSVVNELGGSDLYRVSRDGKDHGLLAGCGEAHCTQPTWSPNGTQIAYSQYISRPEIDSTIHLVEFHTGTADAVLTQETIEGAFPVFSPDGIWLAFFDYSESSVIILNLNTGIRLQAYSQNPEPPAWSNDSRSVYFIHFVSEGELPQAKVFKFDLEGSEPEPFLAAESAGFDVSLLEWSLDGEWAVFGLKGQNIQARRQIYVIHRDGTQMRAVTNDPNTSHSAYHWSPQGGQIIYQRYSPGALDAAPQIVLWDQASGETRVIVENGALPAWLP